MLNWIVREGDINLLTFLKERVKSAPSVKAIKRALDARACLVNDRVERFGSRKLRKGDRVEFYIEEKAAEGYSVVKLYEDDYLLAIDKPVGLVCEDKELQKYLPEYKGRITLVHRLDKETSGVLLLAKTPEAKERMKKLFAERQIEKRYIALVHGLMLKEEGVIDSKLVIKKRIQGQTIYGVSLGAGEAASTLWKCLQKGVSTSLLECQPITGRTHQIRVHMSSIGHPIVGDILYGNRSNEKGVQRCLLHAHTVRFLNPYSKEELLIEAPLPEVLKRV